MVQGGAVLWRALVHVWDESLLMIRANVIWFVCMIPLYLLTLGGIILVTVLAQSLLGSAVDPEAEPSSLPFIIAAFTLILIPSPPTTGVYVIAMHVVNGETPEFGVFWQAVRQWWKRTLLMYVIGVVVFGGLIFNTIFYVSVTAGLLQAVSVLWVYAIVFWLTMQGYLLPLLVMPMIPPPTPTDDDGWPLDEARKAQRAAARPQAQAQATPSEPAIEATLGSLYKRAAILALANPIFSLMLFFGTCITLILSAFAMPVYPLLAMSYVALIHCRGFKVLYDKYSATEAQGAAG